MTTVVITQPTYLPWLGAFELMSRADTYICLDTVQFERRSWQSRNRLKGPDGAPFWLSASTAAAPRGEPIETMRVADQDRWGPKHLRAIETALGGAPHAADALDLMTPILEDVPPLLRDLDLAIIRGIAAGLEISPTFHLASDLAVDGRRSELLIGLCHAVGADRYLSAAGSAAYMAEDQALWDAAQIDVEFQAWEHPVYPQRGPDPFVSHLAAIDAIANVGWDGTRQLISAATANSVTTS